MSEIETNAEIVSLAFVKQYYHTLNESPEFLHMFYNDSCLLNRLNPATHVKKTVWTRQEVKDEFTAVGLGDWTAEIETSLGVPYPMENGGVIVFVNGYLTWKRDTVRNKFTQTFLLAQEENGFYVINDIFRNKEEPEKELMSEPEPHPRELAATERSVSLSLKEAPSKREDDDEWFIIGY